jgi:hypothetical protein
MFGLRAILLIGAAFQKQPKQLRSWSYEPAAAGAGCADAADATFPAAAKEERKIGA